MKQNKEKIYKKDATNQVLGRLASQIASLLLGKDKINYKPNLFEKTLIEVNNISKIKISGNKLKNKNYIWHSGYPGGLKSISLKNLFEKNPEQVFRKVVFNMLPKNRNRQKLIKRLKLSR